MNTQPRRIKNKKKKEEEEEEEEEEAERAAADAGGGPQQTDQSWCQVRRNGGQTEELWRDTSIVESPVKGGQPGQALVS